MKNTPRSSSRSSLFLQHSTDLLSTTNDNGRRRCQRIIGHGRDIISNGERNANAEHVAPESDVESRNKCAILLRVDLCDGVDH